MLLQLFQNNSPGDAIDRQMMCCQQKAPPGLSKVILDRSYHLACCNVEVCLNVSCIELQFALLFRERSGCQHFALINVCICSGLDPSSPNTADFLVPCP